MRLGLTMMALCSLLTACATNALDAGGAPVKPMQRDDESERLPIGRVLTIERLVGFKV